MFQDVIPVDKENMNPNIPDAKPKKSKKSSKDTLKYNSVRSQRGLKVCVHVFTLLFPLHMLDVLQPESTCPPKELNFSLLISLWLWCKGQTLEWSTITQISGEINNPMKIEYYPWEKLFLEYSRNKSILIPSTLCIVWTAHGV